jgi:hypothetical protein
MKYLVVVNGREIYRTEFVPALRDGENYIVIDDLESDAELALRIGLGTRHTLNTLRAELLAKVKAERGRREQPGFAYLGKVIESDPISVQRITVASQAAQIALANNQPFVVDWTCADNTALSLDAQGVIALPVALAQYGLALHSHAQALKSQINAAETLGDLTAIDIQSGWTA